MLLRYHINWLYSPVRRGEQAIAASCNVCSIHIEVKVSRAYLVIVVAPYIELEIGGVAAEDLIRGIDKIIFFRFLHPPVSNNNYIKKINVNKLNSHPPVSTLGDSRGLILKTPGSRIHVRVRCRHAYSWFFDGRYAQIPPLALLFGA
jgi:hypothetical protein